MRSRNTLVLCRSTGAAVLLGLLGLSACSDVDADAKAHVDLAARSQALSPAEPAPRDLIKVPFADRREANLIYKSFNEAVLHTDYNAGFHVLERLDSVIEKLKAAGIHFEPYAQTAAVPGTAPSLAPSTSAGAGQGATLATIPSYPCYNTVEEDYSAASNLASQHPKLARWKDVGDSWLKTTGRGGYDMMVLELTNNEVVAQKPKLFLTCAIHAREYTTAALCLDFAKHLVQGHGTDADATWLLDHHEVHMMLHANPDGRKFAEGGILWRKNVNEAYCGATSNSRGVDLNRNFDFDWNCCNGSSSNQCDQTYRGPTAASEPETQAIQAYMRDLFPDRRADDPLAPAPLDTSGVFLDVHSYSELVLWPWGSTYETAPNHTQLQTLGRRLAYFNGYSPEQSVSLYPTDGATDDFCYGELGVPSYTLEIGTAFFQDCATYKNRILPGNLPALVYAAKVARTPYVTPAGPSARELALSVDSVQGSAQLQATIDDRQFNNVNGTEATHTIVAAEYYIDVPPWQSGAAPQALSPVDGAFDAASEAVRATIATSALTSGRHLVFVRGQDAEGVWGAVSATFLDVNNTRCSTDGDCDDHQYCNGLETCGGDGACRSGTTACEGSLCDENNDRCVSCLTAADCDDGNFCNGTESCNADGKCVAGTPACSAGKCDESKDRCVSCLSNSDCNDGIGCTLDTCNSATGTCSHAAQNALCDNGIYCDGSETCDASKGCLTSAPRCTGQTCDEAGRRCVECLQNSQCDDGISCTLDTCNSATGTCSHAAQNALCDNGLFCDGVETCSATLGCTSGSAPCSQCDEQTDKCGGSQCSVANATDLGAYGSHSTHSADGCAKVTQFPSWWQWTSRVAQLGSNGTGSFPVGFTWHQECTGAGGSGVLSGPWVTLTLGAVSETCPVLIALQGQGNVGLVWY